MSLDMSFDYRVPPKSQTPLLQLKAGLAETSVVFFDSINSSKSVILAFSTKMQALQEGRFDGLQQPSPLLRILYRFKSQDIANVVWAYGAVKFFDAELMEDLARRTERTVGTFNAQAAVTTAWGFARLGVVDQGVMVFVHACPRHSQPANQ